MGLGRACRRESAASEEGSVELPCFPSGSVQSRVLPSALRAEALKRAFLSTKYRSIKKHGSGLCQELRFCWDFRSYLSTSWESLSKSFVLVLPLFAVGLWGGGVGRALGCPDTGEERSCASASCKAQCWAPRVGWTQKQGGSSRSCCSVPSQRQLSVFHWVCFPLAQVVLCSRCSHPISIAMISLSRQTAELIT